MQLAIVVQASTPSVKINNCFVRCVSGLRMHDACGIFVQMLGCVGLFFRLYLHI